MDCGAGAGTSEKWRFRAAFHNPWISPLRVPRRVVTLGGAMTAAALPPEPAARRSRPLWPLALFLAAVGLVVGLSLRSRYPTPDLPGAILLLADGDLDGSERTRMLQRVLTLTTDATAVPERWARLLAAIALADQAVVAATRSGLGGDPPTMVPAANERELLHLGDPMLGNVLAAAVAEVDADRPLARRKWSQVAAQSRLTARPFAGELAAAALQRLR